MKKTARSIFMAALAIALVLFSCTRENAVETPDFGGNEFTACFENVKTTLEDHTPKWVSGDKIGITTSADANVCCDVKDVEKGTFYADDIRGGAPYCAVYPYSPGNTFDGDVLTASVPSDQQLVEGSPIAPGAMVAACISDSKTLNFKNCVALLKITIPSSDIVARVDVTALGGEKIAGKFTMDLAKEALAPSAASEGVYSTVTLRPAGETFEAGSYYIAVIPSELNSFEVVFTNAEDNYVVATGSSKLKLKRSVCTDLGSFFSYSISSAEDMIKWASQSAKFTNWDRVTVENDISFTAEEAAKYVPANNFCGVFDGQNHKITGLTTAVFDCLQGTVENLEIESDIVSSPTSATGILANSFKNELSDGYPSVENVTTRGSIRISGTSTADIFQVGGLIGSGSDIPVRNCRNYAAVEVEGITFSVEGSLYVGGCIGSAESRYGYCLNSENYGAVSVSGTVGGQVKKLCAAGIVGCASAKFNVTGCNSWGNVTSSAAGSIDAACLGGIAGRMDYSDSKIDGCTVRCSVSNTGAAANCYAASVIGLGNTQGEITISNTSLAGSVAGSTVARSNGTVTAENYDCHIFAKKLDDTPYTGIYTCFCPDAENVFDAGLIVAGTYNVLNSGGRDKCPKNTWIASRASIATIIMNMNCDIMTLNELGSTEIEYLTGTLTGYTFVIKPNTAKGTYSYAPGIIYRSSRFEVLKDGIFWLSDPDAPSLVTSASSYSYTDPKDGTVYSASEMRCCVWAHLRDKSSGKTFYWFATHPHIRGDDQESSLYNTIYSLNSGNVRSLLRQIPYVNTTDEPMIIAGDMNTRTGYVSYPLFAQAGLVNAYEAAVNSGTIDSETAAKPGTGPGYDPASYSYIETKRIDHVFFSGFTVASFRNDYTKYYNIAEGLVRHPSDHIAVKARLLNSDGETFSNSEFGW